MIHPGELFRKPLIIGEHHETFPDTDGSPTMGMGYTAIVAQLSVAVVITSSDVLDSAMPVTGPGCELHVPAQLCHHRLLLRIVQQS